MTESQLPGAQQALIPRALTVGVISAVIICLLTLEVMASAAPLADSPWPTYGQNARRNNRSPYQGPQQMPIQRWSFNRSNDHWGTDYRGTDIGPSNTIYLAAGMAGVYAIDATSGQMKWLFSPENTGHETWVEFPPTVASDGNLYVTSENDYIYALSPAGQILWSFRGSHLHTPVSISPDGSTVHFLSEDGWLYALNRANGSVTWRYQFSPRGLYASGRRLPVVYDTAGNLYFGWIDTVWSLPLTAVNGVVVKNWSLKLPVQNIVGPAVSDDGTLYFTANDTIIAVSMAGQVKWLQALAGTAFDRTAAVGADGTVYIGAQDGVVYALNPGGGIKWSKQYVTTTGWGGGVKSNITLDAFGTLYFYGKDGYVYAVNGNSDPHEVLWRYNSFQSDNSYPGMQLSLDADGSLYVPVDEHVALALAPSGPAPSTSTSTATPTGTATPTASATADQSTSTATPTATASSTPTDGPTLTPSLTPTTSPTSTPSFPPTTSPTSTPSFTATASWTPSASPTATPTSTSSSTATATRTATPSSTVTMTSVATATPPPGASLVANGGFETDNNNDGLPDNWSVVPTNGLSFTSRSDTHIEGSYSLRTNSSSGPSFTVYQDVPQITPGATYNFTGWMYVPTTSGQFTASVQLVPLNVNGGGVSNNMVVTVQTVQSSTTSNWVPIAGTIVVPTGGVTLRVQLKVSNLHADVYVDGFMLTKQN